MNDHHHGDAVGGAVMGIMVRMLVVAVVKILHCAVSNITKLCLGRVSPFVDFLKQHELLQSQLLQNRSPIRANSCRVSYEYRTLSNSPSA